MPLVLFFKFLLFYFLLNLLLLLSIKPFSFTFLNLLIITYSRYIIIYKDKPAKRP
jgi:hypothetical protein